MNLLQRAFLTAKKVKKIHGRILPDCDYTVIACG